MPLRAEGPSIAIVDDEPDLQKLYKLAIASKGYRIAYVASDGTDALDKQQSTPYKPDIIVMDHRMPTKNGVETTKEILSAIPEHENHFRLRGRGHRKEMRCRPAHHVF